MAINEPTIYQHYIKFQMKEIYRFENNLSRSLIDGMFLNRKNAFNLRDFKKIANNKKLGKNECGELWNPIPAEIK